MRPKSIERIKLDNEVLPAAVISSIIAIVLLWVVTIMVGAIVISFDPNLNFMSSLAASASMVGSCGPALSQPDTLDIGPFGGYGDLQGWTKIVLSVQMVFGRLELLTVLALFSPNFWRR